jgi:hypothetical protein
MLIFQLIGLAEAVVFRLARLGIEMCKVGSALAGGPGISHDNEMVSSVEKGYGDGVRGRSHACYKAVSFDVYAWIVVC